jgi:HK97 family phage major capsid protein
VLGTAQKVNCFAGVGASGITELNGNFLAPQSLVAMVQAVDPAYYRNAAFYMPAQVAWNMRQVTDSSGRPLLNWANGLSADDVQNSDYTHASPVAQLFGFPVMIDNSIANLTASTCSGAIFGSLDRAMVMRTVRNDAQVTVSEPHPATMRLTERYADYLQVGYIGYVRVDMRSNDLRAAVIAKPAAT